MGYVRVPIETNPETLAQDVFDYITAQEPNWTPADGNLDVWIIRAIAAKAAENRTLASDVPDSIFGFFGSSLMAIPPVDAVQATADTTWTLTNTVGHTIPAGTFVGIRNDNGDLITFATVADVIVAPGDNVTAAGEVLLRAVDAGTQANGLSATPELIDVIDWVQSIAIVGSSGGGVDAETNDTYLNRLTTKLQQLSTVPILIEDFAQAAKDADPGVYRAVAIDLYNPFHNLLTANEADAETDAAGWASVANATVASTSAQAANGTKSVSLTAVAGANMSAATPATAATGKAVTHGETVTGVVSLRAASVARSCKAQLQWIDNANAVISTLDGAAANDSTSAWTVYTVTGVAPAGAVKVRLVVFVTSPGASEVHYADKASLRHDSSTDWVQGGTAETDNVRTVTVAAVTSTGAAVSSGIKTAIQNYIEARREANFVVHVMDRKTTNIDVDTSVKVLLGYDLTSVQTDVINTITTYLSPSNWGQDPTLTGTDAARSWVDQTTLYYNELIALVSNVQGVDRVIDLTCNIHGETPARIDVDLDDPAALTTVGTISCTVT